MGLANISGKLFIKFLNKVSFNIHIFHILQAFENYTKVENGYTSISNVKNIHNTRPRDMTESFWFAETLKYLYLLFDDTRQLIDLDKWVFNSEGHPLPIYEL